MMSSGIDDGEIGVRLACDRAAPAHAPHREGRVFLRGLFNQQAFASSSPHLGRMPNLLSGAKVSLDPCDIRIGTSLGQVLAAAP